MIVIKNLNPDNVSEVAQIEKETIETPWGLNELKKDIENKNAFYVCLNKDGKTVGYGGIWFMTDMADITNIAVLNDFRRLGFGSLIVTELTKEALKRGCVQINLEVNEHNTGAIALYKKCGFSEVGRRKKYYHHKDDAILMQYNKRDNENGENSCD